MSRMEEARKHGWLPTRSGDSKQKWTREPLKNSYNRLVHDRSICKHILSTLIYIHTWSSPSSVIHTRWRSLVPSDSIHKGYSATSTQNGKLQKCQSNSIVKFPIISVIIQIVGWFIEMATIVLSHTSPKNQSIS